MKVVVAAGAVALLVTWLLTASGATCNRETASADYRELYKQMETRGWTKLLFGLAGQQECCAGNQMRHADKETPVLDIARKVPACRSVAQAEQCSQVPGPT